MIELILLVGLPQWQMVSVRSCSASHEFLPTYADNRLTIPTANPLLTDSNGQLRVYVKPDATGVELSTWNIDLTRKVLYSDCPRKDVRR